MKPSTLIALLIAVVLGLVAITAARLLNLFGSPPPVAAEPQIKVLVANQNIVKGALIEVTQVMVRPIKSEEVAAYRRDSNKYLPPLETAVYLRIAHENILADTPIRTDQLEPFENPEGVPERLAPNMQPVNLSVRPEDSSGGLLRVGDWVNVLMTSLVTGPGLKDSPRQVLIVPNARVILKRNTLRPIYAALPTDKPVPFTIETNSYRAALLEFARDKGDFSLVAIPEVEGQRLETARTSAINASKSSDTSRPELHLVAFSDPRSDPYKKELQIVSRYEQTAAPISNVSLQELFNLTIPPPLPPKPGPRPNTVIQQFSGTQRLADVVVAPDNRVLGRSDRGLGGRERGPTVVNTNLGTYMDYDDYGRGDVYDEHPYDWNRLARGRDGRDDIVYTEFIFRKPSLVSDTFTANPPLPEPPKGATGATRTR
jgi:Flp pilus assembly protein CpaB